MVGANVRRNQAPKAARVTALRFRSSGVALGIEFIRMGRCFVRSVRMIGKIGKGDLKRGIWDQGVLVGRWSRAGGNASAPGSVGLGVCLPAQLELTPRLDSDDVRGAGAFPVPSPENRRDSQAV